MVLEDISSLVICHLNISLYKHKSQIRLYELQPKEQIKLKIIIEHLQLYLIQLVKVKF